MSRRVFVFGSNLAGRHGKGAALAAKNFHGAIQGQGEGLQGNSYAIPTKDAMLTPLSLARIQMGANRFLEFARINPEMSFQLTAIGCGLAGYKAEQIGPMFASAPPNVLLPEEFKWL